MSQFLQAFFGSICGFVVAVILWGVIDFFINSGVRRFVIPWFVRGRDGVRRGYIVVKLYWRDHRP